MHQVMKPGSNWPLETLSTCYTRLCCAGAQIQQVLSTVRYQEKEQDHQFSRGFLSSPHTLSFQAVLMIKAAFKTSFYFSSHWGKSLSHFPTCRCIATRVSSSHPFLGIQGKDETTLAHGEPSPSSLHNHEQPHLFQLQHYALVLKVEQERSPGQQQH